MYVMFFVLDNPELLTPVLKTYYNCGIKGATVLNSTGMGRILAAQTSILPNLRSLFQGERQYNYTIYALIQEEANLDKLAAELEKVTGSFEKEGTGKIFVIPVVKTYGFKNLNC